MPCFTMIWSVAPFIFITDIFFDKISPEDTDTGDISLILMTLRQTWMTQLIQTRLQNFVP